MSKPYTKHKICRKTQNMAQNTAKRGHKSAILSAKRVYHAVVWHIFLRYFPYANSTYHKKRVANTM